MGMHRLQTWCYTRTLMGEFLRGNPLIENEQSTWDISYIRTKHTLIRLQSHSSILYTIFAIRYMISSPPQMTFKWCSVELAELRRILPVAEIHRTVYSKYCIQYTPMWLQPIKQTKLLGKKNTCFQICQTENAQIKSWWPMLHSFQFCSNLCPCMNSQQYFFWKSLCFLNYVYILRYDVNLLHVFAKFAKIIDVCICFTKNVHF